MKRLAILTTLLPRRGGPHGPSGRPGAAPQSPPTARFLGLAAGHSRRGQCGRCSRRDDSRYHFSRRNDPPPRGTAGAADRAARRRLVLGKPIAAIQWEGIVHADKRELDSATKDYIGKEFTADLWMEIQSKLYELDWFEKTTRPQSRPTRPRPRSRSSSPSSRSRPSRRSARCRQLGHQEL